jgi:hypothetical protein
MKFSSITFTLPLLLAIAAPSVVNGVGCVTGDLSLTVKSFCNYTAVLNSFREWYAKPGNVGSTCANSAAEDELLSLLQVTSASQAATAVKDLCAEAFDTYPKVPFQASTESNVRFVEEFFKGNGDWNEQVATLFPPFSATGNDRESMLLSRDAKAVPRFYDNDGRRDLVDLPPLPNFENCEMNASKFFCL